LRQSKHNPRPLKAENTPLKEALQEALKIAEHRKEDLEGTFSIPSLW
jgi:hypothetical protein